MTVIPAAVSTTSLSDFAKRATEAAGLAAAALYVLGMMRTVGELRDLNLSTPTVLAGFEHSDLLMKGVGVLASHISSLVLMVGAIAMFTSRSALEWTNLRIVRGGRVRNLVLVMIAGLLLVLGSRMWEGLVFALLVVGLAVWLVVRRHHLTRPLALLTFVAGLGLIGIVGSYLHAPPPMRATVDREGGTELAGLLIGKGAEGDWYLATERGSSFRLEVIGGSVEAPTSVTVHPADDEGYRTVAAELLDRFD